MILKSKVIHNMKIDFNEIEPMTIPGMNGGIGMMTAKMYNDENYRIIPTTIHTGGSIGSHYRLVDPLRSAVCRRDRFGGRACSTGRN